MRIGNIANGAKSRIYGNSDVKVIFSNVGRFLYLLFWFFDIFYVFKFVI